MDDDTILPTGDESSPELSLSHRRAAQRIRDGLAQLDQRDVLILNLYYTEELTYTEIGEVLDITRSRVCQLHGRAIARLRAIVTTAGGNAEEAA